MKKNYLYVLLVFLFVGNIYAQTTETFETEITGSKTFTNNNQTFTITTQKGGSFSIVEYTGKGWNGIAADNRFIDNTGTADFGAPVEFTVSGGGVKFNLKSLYLYLSTVQLGTPTGSCTIKGKLSGATVFTATKNNGFIDPTVTNSSNGYTKIDLVNYNGTDNSNKIIDEFVITTTGQFEYVALDAMNWKIDCSALLAPTANSPQAFCSSGTVANLTATGNNLKWYADNVTSTALLSTAALTSKTYYVSQTDGPCESPRKAVVVTVTPNTSNSVTLSACDEYIWVENSTKYTESGTYYSVKGCDTQTLVLTITPKTANTTTITACGEYTWTENSTKYTASGTYYSVKGCDTQTLVLTITPKTANTTTITACGEYTWTENSTKYTESGTYYSVKGCDTQTLVLTITPKTANTTTITACGEYTWTENSTKYTASGTYYSVKGCDTQTLVLTITPKTANTTTITACGEYTWTEKSTKYTESGTYYSVKGCDTQTLVLTITPNTINTTTIAACDNYIWPLDGKTYSVSGTYTGTTTNCITEVLDLTISSIDKSLKFENGVLTSNTQHATYQWMDCKTNTAIPGATNLNFTPVVNGTYSVLISLGSCSITSDCFAITTLGREQFNFDSGLKVYPNPSHNVFNIAIESNATLEVFDISGKKIKTQTISQGNSKLDASSFSIGIYVLKITNENNQTKIIKVTKN